jgi:hypothetical protein
MIDLILEGRTKAVLITRRRIGVSLLATALIHADNAQDAV